jgi:AbrB family looped-hinge helix DNA binding protein
MAQSMHVKVSRRYQISLPHTARQHLNIQIGDQLLVDIQDGLLILVPQPQDYAARLAGLHREVWQGLNTTAYLQQEREAWGRSATD